MKLKRYQAISRLLEYMVYCENHENNMTEEYEIAKKQLKSMINNGFRGFSLVNIDNLNLEPQRLVFSIYEHTIFVRPSLSHEYIMTVKGKHEGKAHISNLMDRFLTEIIDFE